MNILVLVASRHNATRGIANALGEELQRVGHVVEIAGIPEAPPVTDHDAVVIGSAVYVGKWLKEARGYIELHKAELSRMPVWLFSSGPVGPAAPSRRDDPQGISSLVNLIGARGHRTFQGKLDPADLGLGERFIIWNVKRFVRDSAREGDFRDWSAIAAWADEISAALPVSTRT